MKIVSEEFPPEPTRTWRKGRGMVASTLLRKLDVGESLLLTERKARGASALISAYRNKYPTRRLDQFVSRTVPAGVEILRLDHCESASVAEPEERAGYRDAGRFPVEPTVIWCVSSPLILTGVVRELKAGESLLLEGSTKKKWNVVKTKIRNYWPFANWKFVGRAIPGGYEVLCLQPFIVDDGADMFD